MTTDSSPEIDRILEAAALVRETSRRVHDAFEHRAERGDEQWHSAAQAAHQALAALYPDDLWADVERARGGDPEAIDRVLLFLEADPWCFRSGYAKETMLRLLRQVELTSDRAERARAIILHAVDVGDRREFREGCRLAKRVVNDKLRGALLDRLRSSDPGRARRALWVLDALKEPLNEADRERVLVILEQSASIAEWFRVATWARPYARRYGDQGWFAGLLDRVCAGGPDVEPALRLLTSVRISPSDSQRQALAALVLQAIQTDETEWLEWGAVYADSPELRRALIDAYKGAADGGVRERAWWAINAIRWATKSGWPGDELGT